MTTIDGLPPQLTLERAVAVSSPGASALYLALTASLALLGALGPSRGAAQVDVLVLAGVLSLVALLVASCRLRSNPAPSWTASQRDPFLAFAGALAVLLVPVVLEVVGLGTLAAGLGSHAWTTGAIAAALAGVGFTVMLSDLAPGRALDSLYLAGIAATAVGLLAWIAMTQLMQADLGTTAPVLGRLGVIVLDIAVVGLGLQALHLRSRARAGCWLLLLAWTGVLVAHVSSLLTDAFTTSVDTTPLPIPWIIAFGLLGAAALHPDTTQLPEPVFGPLNRLSPGQILLLATSVLLGPGILAYGLHDSAMLPLVLGFSAALSLLVVVHLIRLVQGRAVFEHRAHHDELTGLANRTLLEDRAGMALAHARRTSGHSAMLFLDLDRFKNVNDSLGHATGNLLLQGVAARLRSATRAEDTVARLGGDEFVVFLPQLTHPDDAAMVAADILEEFEQPFTLNDHRLFASPSIGIAVFPMDGDDADGLLKNADTAMYRAKQRGRRTFCAYDASMNVHAHERLALENKLHTAVERGELRLHYQPKIHLPSGRVTGMEALLRWEHPELGLLEPGSFIALAEESGLIIPVGEWALQEACRQNQAWVDAGFAPLVVAVNLSLRQFQQQQQMEDVIARVLRSTGLDPTLLELELTESLAMQDPDAVRATLLDIQEMGVTCSIDDFGTGYSGLGHLTRFPIDKLKIDKSFVATIQTDREAPIVVAVVALAHGLGLAVVAEGVETDEQLERLRELGCDEMQGYLFSRPLTPEHFEQLLMLEAVSQGPGRLLPPLLGVPRLLGAAS